MEAKKFEVKREIPVKGMAHDHSALSFRSPDRLLLEGCALAGCTRRETEMLRWTVLIDPACPVSSMGSRRLPNVSNEDAGLIFSLGEMNS
jgi:hypothetical protein